MAHARRRARGRIALCASTGSPAAAGAWRWWRCATPRPAARSIGLNPVIVKTAAFALSAVFTGLAGGMFAPLLDVRGAGFVSVLAVDPVPVRGHRRRRRLDLRTGGRRARQRRAAGAACPASPSTGCCSSARRCWWSCGLRPTGVLGLLARLWRRAEPSAARQRPRSTSPRSSRPRRRAPARSRCATSASPSAASRRRPPSASRRCPGKVTSVIGPNGAGKTTVLNLIGGFYRPDGGSIRLGERELAGSAGLEGGARRDRAHLPDHQAVRDHERHRQRADRAAARPARQHARRTRHRATIATPPRRCSPSSATTVRSRRRRATCRTSTAGWSRSRARWPCARACCCSTSPPPA